MSWRDPDWLTPAAPGTGPDAEMLSDDDICDHCEGTGIDPYIHEGRGYIVDCEHCHGTGAWQGDEIDPDSMPGGVDDL